MKPEDILLDAATSAFFTLWGAVFFIIATGSQAGAAIGALTGLALWFMAKKRKVF